MSQIETVEKAPSLAGKPLNNTIYSDIREVYTINPDGRPTLTYMSDNDIRLHQKRLIESINKQNAPVHVFSEIGNVLLVILAILSISYVYSYFAQSLLL